MEEKGERQIERDKKKERGRRGRERSYSQQRPVVTV